VYLPLKTYSPFIIAHATIFPRDKQILTENNHFKLLYLTEKPPVTDTDDLQVLSADPLYVTNASPYLLRVSN